MKAWAKDHERALWWAFLIASITISFLRDPRCAKPAPWWAYALPSVIFLAMWAWMMWTFRGRRRDA